MKFLLENMIFIVTISIIFGIISLFFSLKYNDTEWFQASGAIITIAGIILASRKIIRLGTKNYIKDAREDDYGGIVENTKEIKDNREFNKDIKSYHVSIWLLIIGTFIWAYGGIVLRYLDLVKPI